MITRAERGWAGHFIAANNCRFRRNTLLSGNGYNIVVSTVGLWDVDGPDGVKFVEIGLNRYFETMAFHSKKDDLRYHDADVQNPVDFDSPWSISEMDADDDANNMHEAVVTELMIKMENNEIENPEEN